MVSENGPDEAYGTRTIPFGKELWIEREDFMEVPAKKWFRLAPGALVRLKSAYIVKCESFAKDSNGNITEIHCTYLPESKSGGENSGMSVKGTIHWVSIAHALPAQINLYDRLFKAENPSSEEGDFKDYINPGSLQVVVGIKTSEGFFNIRIKRPGHEAGCYQHYTGHYARLL